MRVYRLYVVYVYGFGKILTSYNTHQVICPFLDIAGCWTWNSLWSVVTCDIQFDSDDNILSQSQLKKIYFITMKACS